MNLLYAVLTLGIIGGIFGVVLAVASRVFAVQNDPRLGEIIDALPGANCGGCGYPGCGACAAAILEGKAPVNACPSCVGEKVSRIAAVMGVEVEAVERRVAFVRCAGGNRASHKFGKYVGIDDCVAAMKIAGNGYLDCSAGCLGLGTCVKACKFDAIKINANGVAEVNKDKCTHCMKCAEVCPRHVIADMPYAADTILTCASKEKGAIAKSHCGVSCISCRLCEKNCPNGAITIKNNLAFIDYNKCTACGICASKCPRKAIVNHNDNGTVAPVVVKQ
ncbi:MAG: RnfABCDGE type electron transport complex subunit B [Oscillospiraceae bacterium]|nr:RnfABCDGE type electron transport complex subunit B [Oscillospiraceae bacterium]